MVALVQRPAPAFTADAVVDGLFETVSLEQFQGKWLVPLKWLTQYLTIFKGLSSFSTPCVYSQIVYRRWMSDFFEGTSPLSARRTFFFLFATVHSDSAAVRFSPSTMPSSNSSSSTQLSLVRLQSPFTFTALTVAGVSTDSKFSHFAWAVQPRKEGGLGPDLKLPLVADRNMTISRDYGVLLENEGIALRGLFIIDPKGTLRYVS